MAKADRVDDLSTALNVKPLILWSHARTTSNLFVKIFSSHPELSTLAYPFYDAYTWGPEKQRLRENKAYMELESTIDHKKMDQESYQHAYDQLTANIKNVFQQGKIPLIKEHVYFVTKPEVFQSNLDPRLSRRTLPTPSIVTRKLSSYSNNDESIIPKVSASNPTVIPDNVLRGFRPIFLIRHPILMISSMYRAASKSLGATVDDEDFPMNASFRWSRLMYDWYLQQQIDSDSGSGSDSDSSPPPSPSSSESSSPSSDRTWSPIIIDAADLINNTELISKQLARLAGISDTQFQLSWTPQDPSQPTNNMTDTFLGALHRSTGVIRSERSTEEILATERARWPREFGVVVAKRLNELVLDTMSDYLYLWEWRLR